MKGMTLNNVFNRWIQKRSQSRPLVMTGVLEWVFGNCDGVRLGTPHLPMCRRHDLTKERHGFFCVVRFVI